MTSVTVTRSSTGERRDLPGQLVDRCEPLRERLGQRVVVQSVERRLPEAVRPKRLLGSEPEDERLHVVEPVDGSHDSRERAGRRAVDPPDAGPERRLPHALEESELEQEPVHAAAGEHQRQIAVAHRIYCAGVTDEAPRRGTLDVLDEELLEDEDLWRDDDSGDHAGWWCVRTDPFPCPADGCTFVAEFMTAAHLVLVWQERDDPNLLWHANRAKQVGSEPPRRLLRTRLRAERLVLRVGGGGTPRPRDQERATGVSLTPVAS